MRRTLLVLACCLMPVLCASAADDVVAAKSLYAEAAYDEALAMLTRLSASNSGAGLVEIEAYRALCLYALGRATDAEAAVHLLLRDDPFFAFGDGEIAPRIHEAFTRARRQILPAVIRDKYRTAKAAFDLKQFELAAPLLTDVRRLLDLAQRLAIQDDALTDLGTLTDGFLELALAATAPSPTPVAVAAPPVQTSTQPTAPPAQRIVTITPAIPLQVDVPRVPPAMLPSVTKRGLYEVAVAADGHVTDVTVRDSISPAYDDLMRDAAKRWRYKPALKEGVPVPSVMSVPVVVSRN